MISARPPGNSLFSSFFSSRETGRASPFTPSVLTRFSLVPVPEDREVELGLFIELFPGGEPGEFVDDCFDNEIRDGLFPQAAGQGMAGPADRGMVMDVGPPSPA